MNMMKTEHEVIAKINETLNDIKTARNSLKNGEIEKEALRHYLTDQSGALTALKWVLGQTEEARH